MAKKDPKEYGKKFLEELVALYPADQQATVREIIAKAPEGAIVATGEHILRQEDYSEQMSAVQTLRTGTDKWRNELQTWKTGVDAKIAEGEAAIERLKALDASGGHVIHTDDAGNGGAPDLTGYIKTTDAQKLIDDAVAKAQAYTTNYGAYMPGLVAKHLKEFDEALDTGALLAFCRENNLQIDRGGYDAFVHARRDEVQKKKHEDELKAAEERGFKRALSEGSTELPFPTGPGSLGSEHVTLSGLGQKDLKTNAVSRAVATYHEEIRRRQGGTS